MSVRVEKNLTQRRLAERVEKTSLQLLEIEEELNYEKRFRGYWVSKIWK